MNENEKCVTGTQEATARFEYNSSPRIVEAYGKTYELPKKTVSFLDKILTVGREIVYCKNTSAIVQKLKQGIASLTTLRMAQENFRCITEELNRYPDLDTGEGILKLLAHYILESINKMPEEQWRSIKPDELIKHATTLIKAASYKKDIDLKNKDLSSAGFEQIKSMAFQTMARERPELYSEVAKFLEDKMNSE